MWAGLFRSPPHGSTTCAGDVLYGGHPGRVETGEPGPEQIWREPASRLLARLETKIGGLSTAEAQSRLASYGPNDASIVKSVPLLRQFLVRFENPLIIILLIASGVSALTGGMASFV